MRGVSTQQASQADNCIILPGLGEGTCDGWNLESAGNANNPNVFAVCAAAQKPVERAPQQAFGNELVEPGDDNTKASSGGAEIAFDRLDLYRGCRLIFFVFLLRSSMPP